MQSKLHNLFKCTTQKLKIESTAQETDSDTVKTR